MARGNRHHLLSRLASVGGTALIISSLLLTIGATGVLALDSGAKAPGASTTPNGWTDPDNAKVDDGVYATINGAGSQGYSTFGLGIPNGSIIDGITVSIQAKSSDSSGCTLDVRLSGDGGTTLRTKNVPLTGSDATPIVLGSATDTWGQVWDPTQLTNGNFQVQLRAVDPGSNCTDGSTTSVDFFTVLVTYRTIDAATTNPALSGSICQAGDFSFVIDMSGSIGAQGNLPSNLQQMKDGINGFVNAFQGGGGDGLYAGTRFNDSAATNLTAGFTSSATFLTAVNALSGPTGLTPTALGITTATANTAGGRAGVPNVMFVLTDGSPNRPNTHSDDLSIPETWLQGANGAVGAANSARTAGFVVKAVYLSTPQDPGDTSLPFSDAGDSAWATTVMNRIGGGSHLDSDFHAFVNDLFSAINCPPPPPITTQASAGVDLGGSITDTAHLIGGASTVGSITFKAYGPDDANCSTVVFTSDPVAVSGTGNYASTPAYTPSQPGKYRWRAFYTPTVSGNPNNPPSSTACNDDNEDVIVKAIPAIVTSDPESVTVGTAVTDSATLSNATATASGTITFNLYSDSQCQNLVGTKSVDIGTGGNGKYGPVSITPGAPGTYHWIASYSGDSRNKAVAGKCNDTGENDTVIKAHPGISTVASGTGSPNAIDIGASITDTATLSNGVNPTGTITFLLFAPGDTTCVGTPAFTSAKPVSGNGPYTSDPFTPLQMGKYRWTASYNGDTNNDPASGACNASNEDVVVKPAAPGISTSLSGAGQTGANITVPLGTAVTDTATLTGATATAGGTVKYTVFSDATCQTVVFDAGTKNVVNHVPGISDAFTVTSATTYYWQADYSGDNNNKASSSACSLETVTVTKNQPKVDTVASATVQAGGQIHDQATLSGGFSPTGTLTFRLYGPNDATCTGTVQLTTTVPVSGNGNYFSANFTANLAGAYRWIANYNGDANNVATTNGCNGDNENVDVTKKDTAVDTQASGSVETGGDIWDVATLSGGVNPTGTITFKLYGPDDATCTGTVRLTSTVTVDQGNHQYTSDPFTTTGAGTWRWIANYSGDANNKATANTCNAANENVSVTKKSPTIATVATVGGQPGDKIHDTSSLSGAFLPTGGTVTFKLYGPNDDTCAAAVATFTSQVGIAANGTATSADFTSVLAGTYHWTASYSGDANNIAVASKCGDDNETTTLSKFGPDISTSLTSGDASAAKITVLFGSDVTDQATLTGFGPGAGGTVEYNVYSDDQCQNWFAGGGTKDVVNGVAGASDAVHFPMAGKFYWQAHYSGDANNAPATSACTDEVVTVITPKLHIEKTVNGEHDITASPGDVLTYTLSVENTGDAAATGEVVTDDLSAVLAHSTLGTIGAGASVTGTTLTWNVPTILPGSTVTLSFTVTLDSVFPNGTTIIPNAVVMVGPGSNCTPEDNEDADCNTTVTVEAHPNIHAEKTVDGEHATQAHTGDVLHYSITATNSGDAAGPADISDDITAILDHATIGTISDSGVLGGDGVIHWPQFLLAANGGSKTVTFTVTLDAQFPAGTTTLPNAVVVVGTGSNCPDQSQLDVAALEIDPGCVTTTTVGATPHITAFKLVQDGDGDFVHSNTAAPGDVLHWKIVITNDGDAPVTPVLHAEDIAKILLHAKYNNDCDGGCTFGSGHILTWLLASLAAHGGSVTLNFSVTLDSAFPVGTTVLPNAVVVEDSNCVPENNEDADCTTDTTVTVQAVPTPPPTDALAQTGPSNPGSNLALILAALGTLMLGISFVTPVPAVIRRRNRR